MKGFGGMGDMAGMLKQAQRMQKDMARVQEELKERIVEGTAGGGMVKALVNGQQELVSLKIDPSVIDPADASMLEDLVAAAVQNGLKASREMMQAEIQKVTGGMGLPGLGM